MVEHFTVPSSSAEPGELAGLTAPLQACARVSPALAQPKAQAVPLHALREALSSCLTKLPSHMSHAFRLQPVYLISPFLSPLPHFPPPPPQKRITTMCLSLAETDSSAPPCHLVIRWSLSCRQHMNPVVLTSGVPRNKQRCRLQGIRIPFSLFFKPKSKPQH